MPLLLGVMGQMLDNFLTNYKENAMILAYLIPTYMEPQPSTLYGERKYDIDRRLAEANPDSTRELQRKHDSFFIGGCEYDDRSFQSDDYYTLIQNFIDLIDNATKKVQQPADSKVKKRFSLPKRDNDDYAFIPAGEFTVAGTTIKYDEMLIPTYLTTSITKDILITGANGQVVELTEYDSETGRHKVTLAGVDVTNNQEAERIIVSKMDTIALALARQVAALEANERESQQEQNEVEVKKDIEALRQPVLKALEGFTSE